VFTVFLACAGALAGSLWQAGVVWLAAGAIATKLVAGSAGGRPAPRGAAAPLPRTAWRGLRGATSSASLVVAGLAAGLVLSAWFAGRPDRPGDVPARLAQAQKPPRGSAARAARDDADRYASTIARARRDWLPVYSKPRAGRVRMRLQPRRVGKHELPLAMLVDGRRGDWLRVYVPRRPNGAKGWVRRRHVALSTTPYRVVVDVPGRRLTVKRGWRTVVRTRIGTGAAITPTPGGRYFVTDLLRQPDPRGLYGPYVLGLSGYSPVVTSFNGGDGQLGIHGTNDPSSLGAAVSHGCIRMPNRTIKRLARILPLGTPVTINVKPRRSAA
jgi:lipoprotein-anchoring transpeptidase ErfK/SrfK